MEPLFADRVSDVPQSFIREILKVTIRPEIISFAGGLPNRKLFPVEELRQAANNIFRQHGQDILQYSNTEGYLPLRQYIAERYRSKGLEVSPDNVLITTGSQQGLDLMAKTLINEGDEVLMEEPGYLGAIQAFALYRSTFLPVPVSDDGMDIEVLRDQLRKHRPKLLYMVPNFQNPSGISYSEENRRQVARELESACCYLIEDDPYGELRFAGEPRTSFAKLLPKHTILFGSFSKTVAPGLRLGWLVAPQPLLDKLIIAKQGSDLHTSSFNQRLLYQFLTENTLDDYIAKITEVYGRQKRAMIKALKTHLPAVRHTDPEGGMFLWLTLGQGRSAMALFEHAIKRNVAFVPGNPFYTNQEITTDTLRLNFSCVDEETIDVGIQRLADAYSELIA